MKLLPLLRHPLPLIMLLGAIFRFTNLNWDEGGRLHPDEALIVHGAQAIQILGNWFPGFHDYNGLSVYLLRLVSPGESSPVTMTVIGRFLSATLSTATILIVYLIAKKLWNKSVAPLAALLFALTPLSVQLAHFYTTESILVFLWSLLIYVTLLFIHKSTWQFAAAMGILSGTLLATKNTSYLFLPIPTIALFFSSKKFPFVKTISYFVILLPTFFICSPYSFLDSAGYVTRSQYLSDVVSGKLLMDWTLQFQNTTTLFWIPNVLIAFGGSVILAAVYIFSTLTGYSKHPKILFVLCLWTLGFGLFLGVTYLKFIRYAAPLIPLVSLFAAKVYSDLWKQRVGKLLTAILILIQILWASMIFSTYLSPHPAALAAEWVSQNIPPGQTILREEWNSIIHFDTGSLAEKQHKLLYVNMYTQPDTLTKKQTLEVHTKEADYIIIESPKVKNTITRLAHIYPNTSLWYQNLENGSLGYKKIAEFTNYPRLGRFVIDDSFAEETWYAFDHPSVTIYQKQ